MKKEENVMNADEAKDLRTRGPRGGMPRGVKIRVENPGKILKRLLGYVMNRADINYGGHGTTALGQLTAYNQFCYSPTISSSIYWQRRLGGNVPDYVKQAVNDCLTKGIRNHGYLYFRSSNRTGTYVQIGGNWYF